MAPAVYAGIAAAVLLACAYGILFTCLRRIDAGRYDFV